MKWLIVPGILLLAVILTVCFVIHRKTMPAETYASPNATSTDLSALTGTIATESSELADNNTTSALFSGAPFQPAQVAATAANWPHYADAIITVPYPPNWYYSVTYSANDSSSYAQFPDSSQLVETISFSEKVGAKQGSDGAYIEIEKNPLPIAEELADPGVMLELGSMPAIQYLVPNRSYPAAAQEFDDNGFEYTADVRMACGGDFMNAQFSFIPGEEPLSESSTVAIRAMINGLEMRQCE